MELPAVSSNASEQLYRSLPVKPWQTRLLRIHPASSNELIRGELLVADITHLDGAVLHDSQDHVEYSSLSYVWGDGPFCKCITLNGLHMFVKDNLFSFLLRYRERTSGSQDKAYIWIDAICINQADSHEKSQQVSSMLAFYEHAKVVLVWLGEGTKGTDTAMKYLREQQSNDVDLKVLCRTEPRSDLVTGLFELYYTPWAGRIWVKQEIWAAQQITVLRGSKQIFWSQFTRPLESLSESQAFVSFQDKVSRGSISRIAGPSSRIKALLCLRQKPREDVVPLRDRHRGAVSYKENQTEIFNLVREARHCQSTDVRDRVYALLGICGNTGIEIDYTASAARVFASLAHHMIEREGRVSMILALRSRFGSTKNLALPSWVPDWRFIDDQAIENNVWRTAFDPILINPNDRLHVEAFVPLSSEARAAKQGGENAYRQSAPYAPETLFLRGFVVGIIPENAVTSSTRSCEKRFTLPWNPLAVPIVLNSATSDQKLHDWQNAVRTKALHTLSNPKNSTSPSSIFQKAVGLISPKKTSPSLASSSGSQYDPLHERFATNLAQLLSSLDINTEDDIQRLGQAEILLSLNTVHKTSVNYPRTGDLLVYCHGSGLPLVLRPLQDGKCQFVCTVSCTARYAAVTEHLYLPIRKDLLIMLHAREALGGVETFTVV